MRMLPCLGTWQVTLPVLLCISELNKIYLCICVEIWGRCSRLMQRITWFPFVEVTHLGSYLLLERVEVSSSYLRMIDLWSRLYGSLKCRFSYLFNGFRSFLCGNASCQIFLSQAIPLYLINMFWKIYPIRLCELVNCVDHMVLVNRNGTKHIDHGSIFYQIPFYW